MRRGFSLVELVLVLAVAGLLFGIALPRLAGALNQIEVASAANHVLAAHRRARMLAVLRGQVLVLTVDSTGSAIRVRGNSGAIWVEEGPSGSGVLLEGSARQFTFSPEGLTLGLSNATLRFTRGAAARSIVISRLGRLRILR
jgi:prepilin-type N-terminal cleavage/methylation domain-containing protein